MSMTKPQHTILDMLGHIVLSKPQLQAAETQEQFAHLTKSEFLPATEVQTREDIVPCIQQAHKSLGNECGMTLRG